MAQVSLSWFHLRVMCPETGFGIGSEPQWDLLLPRREARRQWAGTSLTLSLSLPEFDSGRNSLCPGIGIRQKSWGTEHTNHSVSSEELRWRIGRAGRALGSLVTGHTWVLSETLSSVVTRCTWALSETLSSVVTGHRRAFSETHSIPRLKSIMFNHLSPRPQAVPKPRCKGGCGPEISALSMDLLPQVLCSTPSLYAHPNTSHLLQCRQGRGRLDLRETEVSRVTTWDFRHHWLHEFCLYKLMVAPTL